MILLFGKSGQLATEIQKISKVIALDRYKADLSNPTCCADIIKDYLPEVVINAAAYTSVDKAEDEEKLAKLINAESPKEMALMCCKLNIPLIHISTDYVFSGKGLRSWKPTDQTDPINTYGRTKLAGEINIISSGVTYAIIRTSWVISAHGNNFVKNILRLSENKKKLNIINDQVGGPTPAKDLAIACLKIAKKLQIDKSKSGVYHLSGAPNISWAKFAEEIFKLSDKNVIINPIATKEFKSYAARPLNSRLDCKSIENNFGIKRPNWKKELKNIIRELKQTV